MPDPSRSKYTAQTEVIAREVDTMQLVLIALIGVGTAVVVGLFGPLSIRAGRALQDRLGVTSAAQSRRLP